ncbi:MAG TPA: hypothetical protein DCX54_00250 [Flavobacteriales bacterium]|nr:hypothetical protein [Flavobacteriales bacterium]
MKFLLGLVCVSGLLFPNLLSSQSAGSKVDLENLDHDLLSNELIIALNNYRKEKGLSELEAEKVLSEAALDQAMYNRKSNSVSSEQIKKKKITAFDRVRYYKGLFYKVDEFDIAVEVDSKTRLKSSTKTQPSSYREISEYILEEWRDDRKLDVLLTDEAFFKVGIGFAPNKVNQLLFASIVVGSAPYKKEKNFSYSSKSHKINPYDREVCKIFERTYSYLPELFSNNLRIEGNRIVFYYHDLALIEGILDMGKDALAVDIMTNEQFACDHGNMLHPSPVHKGMMLKPVKKSKLFKLNKLKGAKEFRADLGAIPAGMDTSTLQFALLVIKDKCLCSRISTNNLKGKNIRLLDIELAIDTLSISQNIDSNSRFLEFTVPFEKSKYDYEVEDIKPFLDSIQLNRFNIREIEVTAYSSIEGNPISNMNLQQRRAESILHAIGEYQLQEVKTKIETHENWDGFMESIKGSPYEAEYKNLSKDEIRMVVNSDTLQYDLEPYLADQRKANIRIFVESIYIDSLTPEKLPSKFQASIQDEEYIRSKAIQTLMYRAVLNGELDTAVLFEGDIPQYKQFVPLANNRVAFRMQFQKKKNSDSLVDNLRMEIEALLGVEPTNGHINFNKQAIKLYYWAKDLQFLIIDEENKVDQPKDFYKDIRKLYNTKIDNYKVNRLLLNYNIISADFYYDRRDFRNRIKALKQVKKYVQKAKLNRTQTFIMAKYFIYQMQIDWAVQIMSPFIKSGDYDSDFMMTYLSISIYTEKLVKQETYYEYLKIASEKYGDEFCELFRKPGMSKEYLSDLKIKSIYCENCK